MKSSQNKIKSLSKKISAAMSIGLAIYAFVTIFAVAGLISSSMKLEAPFLQGFFIGNIDSKTDVKYLVPLLIAIFVGVLLTCAQIFILQRIFSDISCDASPFDKKHTKRLKLLAVIQIISSIFNVTAYTLETVARHNGWSFQLDIGGIVFGVLLYCVALIYDYGCDLQQQSDETL